MTFPHLDDGLSLHSRLWWLAQELDNTADAIGPVPDLAEASLRRHARTLEKLASEVLRPTPQDASVGSSPTRSRGEAVSYRTLPEHLSLSIIEASYVERHAVPRRRWWRFGR